MGNICRSPLAAVEGARAFAAAGLGGVLQVDSAGTLDFHSGRPADARSIALAADHGLDLSGHRARQVRRDDFESAELVVVMDRRNLSDLRAIAPVPAFGRIRLLLEFAGQAHAEVPDPYYGGRAEFEHSFELIRTGVAGLTKHLARLHNAGHRTLE